METKKIIMDLEQIKIKLSEEGYDSIHRKDNDYSWLQCFKASELANDEQILFNLVLDSDIILFRDGTKQITNNVKFENTKELIKYINKLYAI